MLFFLKGDHYDFHFITVFFISQVWQDSWGSWQLRRYWYFSIFKLVLTVIHWILWLERVFLFFNLHRWRYSKRAEKEGHLLLLNCHNYLSKFTEKLQSTKSCSPLNHVRVCCWHDAHHPQIFSRVFPTNKDILLHNHNITLKINNLTLIFRQSNPQTPFNFGQRFFIAEGSSSGSSSESHVAFSCCVRDSSSVFPWL